MCLRRSIPMTLFLSLLCIFFILCIRNKSTPVEPKEVQITDEPVEDTTRIYIKYYVDVDGTIVKVDTIPIYPKAVFARFHPWVRDTAQIMELAQKHNLRLYSDPGTMDQQLSAMLCVTDNRRAEYHFTPYGKEGFANFGADSLVEYAFGVFASGFIYPSGNIVFKFIEGTPQARIDSLFDANGLRLLRISPDFPTGKRYRTLVTPLSKKNVLDLGFELQSQHAPFLIYANVSFGIGSSINCDE